MVGEYTIFGKWGEPQHIGAEDHPTIDKGVANPGEKLPDGAFPIESVSPGEVLDYQGTKDGSLYAVRFDPASGTTVDGIPVRTEKI